MLCVCVWLLARLAESLECPLSQDHRLPRKQREKREAESRIRAENVLSGCYSARAEFNPVFHVLCGGSASWAFRVDRLVERILAEAQIQAVA